MVEPQHSHKPAQVPDQALQPNRLGPRRHWIARVQRRLQQRWYVLRHPALMQPAMQDALATQIAASEAQHQGQIAVYVERELPAHYIHSDKSARERAVVLFGKLGVWDTAHNNGVLIYLLEAEHAIEIVADRGVLACTQAADWAAIAQQLGQLLQNGDAAKGLQLAIDAVSALLLQHFPRQSAACSGLGNEVPDLPVAPLA